MEKLVLKGKRRRKKNAGCLPSNYRLYEKTAHNFKIPMNLFIFAP
ncbi:hypothetical protein [Bacteroides nordii]|nr:hypothetical protein [Bacteroides nordii]